VSKLLFYRYVSVSIESAMGDIRTLTHNPIEDKLFRIDFEVSLAGKATIKLYNVLHKTIELCEPKRYKNGKVENYAKAKLVLGYQKERSLFAFGDIIQFYKTVQGTDTVLELKINPKTDLLNEIAIQKNYSGTWISVLSQILKDNSIDYFEIDSSVKDLGSTEQFIVDGTLKTALDKICKTFSLEYFFDINKLIFILKKQGRKSIQSDSVVLNRLSGLVGFPARKGNNWNIKSLLNHKIRKGSYINLQFDNSGTPIDGSFSVVDGKHVGSSWTNDFYTECEVKPL
jgi:hypothetical protein